MHRSKSKNEIIFRGCLFLILILSVLSACVQFGVDIPSVSTWTPSPSATPTCDPNVSLATPVGWSTVSRLIIILFDPNSVNKEFLEFSDGEKTQSATGFINRIIPKVMRPGDQVSVFQLGYRIYENARYLRVYSYIEPPQLYEMPSPQETLPPLNLAVTGTIDGFKVPQATIAARKTQTAYAITATAIESNYICRVQIWNESAIFTATAYKKIEFAELSTIEIGLNDAAASATKVLEDKTAIETPYSGNVVYEGLYHASIDIESDCAKYDECILLIIDDLNTWTRGNLGDFDINLTGLDRVYVIMPDCKDINQPSCKTLQTFWDKELENYESPPAEYQNGIRAELNLLNFLRR